MFSGCTTINTQVVGWPELKTTEHSVSFWKIQEVCWKNYDLPTKLMIPIALACTEVNLYKGTCDIYHTENTTAFIMAHEREHCVGGDHGGKLQNYFNDWKLNQK